jgi:hypothetical protein
MSFVCASERGTAVGCRRLRVGAVALTDAGCRPRQGGMRRFLCVLVAVRTVQGVVESPGWVPDPKIAPNRQGGRSVKLQAVTEQASLFLSDHCVPAKE